MKKDNLIIPIAVVTLIMLGVGLSVVNVYRNLTPYERCHAANGVRIELYNVPRLDCERRRKR